MCRGARPTGLGSSVASSVAVSSSWRSGARHTEVAAAASEPSARTTVAPTNLPPRLHAEKARAAHARLTSIKTARPRPRNRSRNAACAQPVRRAPRGSAAGRLAARVAARRAADPRLRSAAAGPALNGRSPGSSCSKSITKRSSASGSLRRSATATAAGVSTGSRCANVRAIGKRPVSVK